MKKIEMMIHLNPYIVYYCKCHTELDSNYIYQWRRKMFHCRGAKIVGVSINFNAGGSGGILPQEISKF